MGLRLFRAERVDFAIFEVVSESVGRHNILVPVDQMRSSIQYSVWTTRIRGPTRSRKCRRKIRNIKPAVPVFWR